MKLLTRLIVPCCISMLFIGCLAKEKEHETRRYEVGDEPAFDLCLEEFKKSSNYTSTSDNYIISQRFFLKNINETIELDIGLYEDLARADMGKEFFMSAMFRQKKSGNYLAALRALNSKGITCKQVGEDVEFIFPVNDDSEYDKLAVSCRNDCERIIVNIRTIQRKFRQASNHNYSITEVQ